MELPETWRAIKPDSAADCEAELARELSAGHSLYGLPVRAVALGGSGDDVLFAVEDGTQRVAEVHLTWTQSPPERPPSPFATVYPSLEAWATEQMRADAEDFAS